MTGESNFIDDRHTLYCGWVAGIAQRHGLKPVADENDNWMPYLTIEVSEGVTITLSIPYPPDDWRLAQ